MTLHPDEGTLHAYIDGELPSSEVAALELHTRDCARCATALAEARGLVAAASHAISALDAAPASGSAAHAVSAPLRERIRTRPAFRVPFARAAALLLLAGGTAVVVTRSGPFVVSEGISESASAGLVDADAPAPPHNSAPPEAAAVAEPRTQMRNESPAQATIPARTRSSRNISATTTGRSGVAAMPEADAPSGASFDGAKGVAGGTAIRERAVVAPPAAQVGRAEDAAPPETRPVDRPVAQAAILAAPPPPPPPTPARAEAANEIAAAAAATPMRVTRFRTKSGVVLTLVEERIRTSFAEDANAARRRAVPSAPMRTSRSTTQSAAASAPPAVTNSYQWRSVEQGRMYTLTGPLPVAELEALARRLAELERLP